MKISGFTFIRNGNKLDYPYLESIKSMLPLCDELIVVAGDSEDETKACILNLNEPKIKIIDTIWDESMREGGKILAQQTNIALDHITGDWGLYLQGDEVIHEKYLETVKAAMIQYKNDARVEGLLFNYRHFYGSYQFVGDSPSWYRREIRVVKNNPAIRSYRDAQGFRLGNRKLNVKHINADIYHYGWVRDPRAQQLKNESFHRYWHDDAWMEQHISQATQSDYNLLEALKPFEGTHPAVMQERIRRMDWTYDYDPSRKKMSFKNRLKKAIQIVTGYLPGEYKNYRII
jgi:hypothetical protein